MHDGAVQKEIAQACWIEPATLTTILAGMEKKELIKRSTSEGNRRSLRVFLTAEGRRCAEAVAEAFADIDECAMDGFSDNEKEALSDALRHICSNFRS